MGEALVTLATVVMTLLSSPVGIIIALVVAGLAVWAPRFRWGLAMACLVSGRRLSRSCRLRLWPAVS
jgi:hypothetical protein